MMIDKSFSPMMEQIFSGHRLSREEVSKLVDAMVEGRLSDVRIAAVLTGLRFAPWNSEIMMGALTSVLRHVEVPPTYAPQGIVDCSGTGGDSSQTVNISTMAGVVASACGARVAKFGSRSVTSRCGSADVLEAQGIPLSTRLEDVQKDIESVGISFLYAPAFYSELRHISQVRRSLGFHTIFDVLVPLANPLPLQGQLLGVYSKDLQVVVGKCLSELGRKRALVVHSDDGLDEVSVCGPTQILKVEGSIQSVEIWKPQDFGFKMWNMEQLRGGGVEENVRAFVQVLEGVEATAVSDAVLFNAAAILWTAQICDDLKIGLEMARHAMVSGQAKSLFEKWKARGHVSLGRA
jgi:anthranilate phosphoribosyltransferase